MNGAPSAPPAPAPSAAKAGRRRWSLQSLAAGAFPLRRLFQLGFLGAVLYFVFGPSERAFEAYCPFGGLESVWGLFREKAYTCTLSEMNLAMSLGLIVLALLAGKAFCSWVCPIGLLNEILFKLGRIVPGLRRLALPLKADRILRNLRYPFAAVMLLLTWKGGELILRGYDPFFLIFSGFGHGSAGIASWIFLGALAVGALVLPMFWCRLLCPLGAFMDIFARIGLIRLHRVDEACTSCGLCDRACLQRLSVSSAASLCARDCTRCLDCVESCPTGALTLGLGLPDPRAARRRWRKLAAWALPAPVAATLLLGVRLADPLTLPTATASFVDVKTLGRPAVAHLQVDGVKCRGTSNLFIRRVSSFPGVAEVEAYAGRHRVVLTFDRDLITPEALRDSINAPVPHPRTGVRYPGIFTCTSMKVEG
jgi:polyferredoxin